MQLLFSECYNEKSNSYFGGGIKLFSGDTVVDIGANIGCFSLFASRVSGRRKDESCALLVSFEP